MYYRRYFPYPYYRRYYNINPYHYRRYYNPYYSIFDSQYSNIDQSINNFGNMTDVYQDADVYQLRTPAPIAEEPVPEPETITEEHETITEPVVIDNVLPEPVSQWRNNPE